jgi:hypothetical protein
VSFAFEFFLRGPEAFDTRGDFVARSRKAVFFFVGHCPSCFTNLVPAHIGGCDWGANWETAVQDCGLSLAK